MRTRRNAPPLRTERNSPPQRTRRTQRFVRSRLAGLKACTTYAVVLLSATLAAQQPPVLDPSVLLKPPTDSWPTYHGDYTGRRYSTLTQINSDNVKTLQLAWVYRLNT